MSDILGRSEILQILDEELLRCRYRGTAPGCLMTPAIMDGKLEPLIDGAYFFVEPKWGAVIKHGTVVKTQLIVGRRAASERRGTCR